MERTTRLVIADDFPLFREGLKLVLRQYQQLLVCGEAGDGKELLVLVAATKPDIVISDIQMPVMNGIEATKLISEQFPAVKVIGLSMYGEQHLILDMLNAGAKGYILKDILKNDLVQAIETVMDGYEHYCSSTSMQLARMVGKRGGDDNSLFPPEKLNEKERDVIRLICEEYASKEIAAATFLTVSTVETYRKRIFEKIGCKNLAGVVVYAVRTGLFRI